MVITIANESDFRRECREWGVSFSYNAIGALWEFFEEVDPDAEFNGNDLEISWVEYDSARDAVLDYGIDTSDMEDDEDEDEWNDLLQENSNGVVLFFDGGVLISQ